MLSSTATRWVGEGVGGWEGGEVERESWVGEGVGGRGGRWLPSRAGERVGRGAERAGRPPTTTQQVQVAEQRFARWVDSGSTVDFENLGDWEARHIEEETRRAALRAQEQQRAQERRVLEQQRAQEKRLLKQQRAQEKHRLKQQRLQEQRAQAQQAMPAAHQGAAQFPVLTGPPTSMRCGCGQTIKRDCAFHLCGSCCKGPHLGPCSAHRNRLHLLGVPPFPGPDPI